MTRPDLQPGYEGWQALDPTPQEKSEGGLGRSGPITEMKKKKWEGTHPPEGLPREGQSRDANPGLADSKGTLSVGVL